MLVATTCGADHQKLQSYDGPTREFDLIHDLHSANTELGLLVPTGDSVR